MSNEVAQTLKREIDRLVEYLDGEIEKLADQHDDETVILEQALLAGMEIPQKEVTAKLVTAVRQLQNHDLLCHLHGQLSKIRKTIQKINALWKFEH